MNSNLSRKVFLVFVSTLILGLLGLPDSQAAEKKDKAARRAAQMMQQMKQQMEQEKAAMQTQFDTQKKDLEEKLKKNEEENQKLQASLEKEKRRTRSLEANLKTVKAEKEAVEAKLVQTQNTLETTQKNLTDMTGKYQQAVADLKVNDAQRKTQLNNLAQTSKSLQNCEAKNDELYQFGLELIKVYDKPSTYEAILRTEQFTQIKRVELENILQDYRDKIDSQHVTMSTTR